ncbi:NACHT nucleoside triphosphatase [Penicillium odoratum]|uniref:NACHT nucleoside triphosphatase n=1 Tax=Penicillium odoratum TaxID=1167516 RepID=UPI0025491364|nr:NACHT nucleoside triphosphatase [Penicillium odoratum]KAJ5776870.1 NACHT nucleoside triphosphatase [Penicillium odoratum]
MQKLEILIQKPLQWENPNSTAIFLRAQDASRFIRYFRTAIESIYYSPAIFTPRKSLTRSCFYKERPDWLLNDPLVEKSWSLCIHTLEGHICVVCSVVWSPNGSRLASGSSDKTVRIWDLATGQTVFTIEGHTDDVCSVAWSADGSRLASGSYDHTVKIWDLSTYQSVLILQTDLVSYLQFDKFNINCLHTSLGSFDIGSLGSVTSNPHGSISSPEQYGYGLSSDSSWITFNGVNLLWLPAEYRPGYFHKFAISATNLAIGCSSGHVIILALTEEVPSLALD